MDFSEQLAAFRARTIDPSFVGLIILGTERHNVTAALLLGTLTLRRVAFLTTPETRDFPQFIAGLLGRTTDGWELPPEDHSSTLQVYRTVKDLHERWGDIADSTQIAVDVTGGLKPMSVGLEKAAHLLGLTTIYVQSDYGNLPDGRRGILPGTQRLVVPPNPYTVFGDLEAAEAERMFNSHDYSGARRVFADLARRVPAPACHTFALYADLARAYAAWDAFDLPLAEQVLVSLVAINAPALIGRPQLGVQAASLQILTMAARTAAGRDAQALATLAAPAAVLALLGSLFANARRREQQGSYDTAALLLYRCLELISQHRLATWGVLTEQPDISKLRHDYPHLDAGYRMIEQQVGFRPRGLPRPQRNGLYSPISLFNGYMLLAALQDSLISDYPIIRIRERSRTRNTSILAHGYRLITAIEYTEFATVVDEMLDRLFVTLARDRTAWEQIYYFVRLG